MTGFTSRPYAGVEDLQALIGLTVARSPERIADYPSIVDLQEMFGTPDPELHARLWQTAASQLAGFALLTPARGGLVMEIADQAIVSDLGAEMISWAEAHFLETYRVPEGSRILRVGCYKSDSERIALLERHGFAAGSWHTVTLVRSLDEPIPASRLPAGFTIRHLAGPQEVDELVALHRAAFGTTHMTVEQRLAMIHTPEYAQELDLVAVAPEGSLAAYAMCHFSRQENALTGCNEGYTDPVATHPEFQRRGLARALLLTGLRLLKNRGLELAKLTTGSDNIPMQETAQSAGFHVDSVKLQYAKEVSEAAGCHPQALADLPDMNH